MQPTITMDVRKVNAETSVVDIAGELTGASEPTLMNAFGEATEGGVTTVVLNFSGLEYMNSTGIGLLVTLLVRANRQHQKLKAFGLSDHYRQILELTRLDEAITIHDSEDAALTA